MGSPVRFTLKERVLLRIGDVLDVWESTRVLFGKRDLYRGLVLKLRVMTHDCGRNPHV